MNDWLAGYNSRYNADYEINLNGPLEIHDEMKKQNLHNRIEIKTLEDEDLEEMNDCEIEVDEDDILPEEPRHAPKEPKHSNKGTKQSKYDNSEAIICKLI